MKRYFYRLNKKYLLDFENSVLRRFESYDKRSVTGFLKSILLEINELFTKIGGRISSKQDIPKTNQYPDSRKYNKLLYGIDHDLEKLYNAQQLIEEDVNNLINFNMKQREQILQNFMKVQQNIYSTYIKSQKDINGRLVLPSGNPFESGSTINSESNHVFVGGGILTLGMSNSNVSKPIDIKNVNVSHVNQINSPIYPNKISLSTASHWKKAQDDPHFIDTKNLSNDIDYRKMMVDDTENPMGVGICEFESVATSAFPGFGNNSVDILKKYIGSYYNKDSEFVLLDEVNSLQQKTIDNLQSLKTLTKENGLKLKLSIPFTQTAILTNSITISFSANRDTYGFYPEILIEESKVFAGSKSYSIIKGDIQNNKNTLIFSDIIIPTRLELILISKGSFDEIWPKIKFYISHYVYYLSRNYSLPQSSDLSFKIALNTKHNVFVDTEPNETSERQRALNIIKGKVK